MYYRVLTVNVCLTFTLCISVKAMIFVKCQDYEVLCDCTLYLYWYLDLLYLYLMT